MPEFEPEERPPEDGHLPGKPDIGEWDPAAQKELQGYYDDLGKVSGEDPDGFATAREEYFKKEKQIKERTRSGWKNLGTME